MPLNGKKFVMYFYIAVSCDNICGKSRGSISTGKKSPIELFGDGADSARNI
jgi:hypothetical protein